MALSRTQWHSVAISGTHLRAWEGRRLIAMLLMKEAIRMQQEWDEHAMKEAIRMQQEWDEHAS